MSLTSWLRSFFTSPHSPSITPQLNPLPNQAPLSRPAKSAERGRRGFSASEIDWKEIFEPQLHRWIEYADRHGEYSEREVWIAQRGDGPDGAPYLGVFEKGKFKTLREDRVLSVHDEPRRTQPPRAVFSLDEPLPAWSRTPSVFRVPSIAGKRHYTVDLSQYTCTCPEKQFRQIQFQPATLGRVCPHMARALRENLNDADNWPQTLLEYIKRPDAGSTAHTL